MSSETSHLFKFMITNSTFLRRSTAVLKSKRIAQLILNANKFTFLSYDLALKYWFVRISVNIVQLNGTEEAKIEQKLLNYSANSCGYTCKYYVSRDGSDLIHVYGD